MRKKLSRVYIMYSTILIGVILLAFSSNPPNGRTGAPGDGYCEDCHTPGNPLGLDGEVTIEGFPSSITPNTDYTITVKVTNPNGLASLAGFQAVVLDEGFSNAGDLDLISGTNPITQTSGGREYVEHNPALTFPGGNEVEWDFTWTAPSGPVGESIRMYAAGNIASGTNGSQQDLIDSISVAGVIEGGGGDPLTVDIIASDDVSCNGGNDGSATALAMGGTSPYNYAWPNGVMTASVNNLFAGTHVVTVTDDVGATATASVTINEPSALNTSVTSTDITCDNANSTATASVSGGTAPYSYNWSTGGSGPIELINSPGAHSLTVTDDNNCTDVEVFVVNADITPPIADSGPDQVLPNGGNTIVDGTASSSGPDFSYFWDTDVGNIVSGQGTTVIVVNAVGNYFINVTDNTNGCSTTSTGAEVTAAVPPDLSIETTDVTCNGGSSGSIDLTVTNGEAPFDYDWDDDTLDGMEDPTGLEAGTYCVTVTDGNNTTASICGTVDEPSAISLSTISVDVSCNGSCDGEASVTASGGTPPYNYEWDDPANQNTATATNLCPGTYTVVVTDSNGCTEAISVAVDEPSAIELTITGFDSSCNGQCDGEATVVATGGTPPYLYVWDDANNQNTQTAVNLCSGTYTVAVTDNNDCVEFISIDISEPPSLDLTGVANDVSCFGECDGSVDLEVSGGVPPYTFLWGDGQNTEDATQLCPGTITVVVTDDNGCTESASFDIGEPSSIEINLEQITDVCSGNCDGSISVSASGGTSPYTYAWDDPDNQTTATAIDLCAGTYTVTVTDANDCTSTGTYTVIESPEINIDLDINEPNCNGGCDGSIFPTVSGGTPPYTFIWSSGQTGCDIDDICAGTYMVTVTDINGCTTESGDIVVSEPDLLTITSTFNAPTCAGECNGSIDLSVSGGTPTYTYNWSNGDTVEDLTDLCEDTYTVTVTDSNGCTEVHTVTISAPSGLTIVPDIIPATCNDVCDGAADISVTGGTPPYAYEWSNGSTEEDPNDLCGGINTVTVTDDVGCSASISIEVPEPNAINITGTSTDATCGDCNGSIDLFVIGGTAPYIYDWSGNIPDTEDQDNLCAGNYTVTVTDANNCTQTFSIDVNTPNGLTIEGAITHASCFDLCDGSIDVTLSGGTAPYTYDWSNDNNDGNEDNNNLCAGEYSVTATDADGCSVTGSYTVAQPELLNITGTVQHPLCFESCNGSITSAVDGGTAPYTYHWNTGSGEADIINLCAGTYSLTVTDDNGCSAVMDFTLADPDPVNPVIVGDLEICTGESTTLDAGAGYIAYDWSTGENNQTITILSSGTYCVTVTDVNGCTGEDCVDVIVNTPPVLQMSSTTESSPGAMDGTATATVVSGTGPYLYFWDDPEQQTSETAINLALGMYCVSVHDISTGCIANGCVTVEATGCNIVLTTSGTDVSCFGGTDGTATAAANSGVEPYSYLWSTGSEEQSITNLVAGVYTITVTDANGCTAEGEVLISEPTAVSVTAITTNPTCNGACDGEVEVIVTGGTPPYAYSWSGPCEGPNPQDVCAGTFTVTVTDANGCTGEFTVTILEPEAIMIEMDPVDASCFGECDGNIGMTVSGGTPPYSFLWDDPNQTQGCDLPDVCAGTYTVVVTDANGCTAVASATVSEPEILTLSMSSTSESSAGANDGTATVETNGGVQPYTFLWDDPNAQTTQTAIGLAAGTYCVTVTDDNGCTMEACVTITIGDCALIITIGGTDPLCFDSNDGTATVAVSNGSGAYTYLWDDPNAQTTQTAGGLGAGTYCVTATDVEDGCSIVACIDLFSPIEIITVSFVIDPTCNGFCDGSIDITSTGGVGNFEYEWSGSLEGPSPDNVCAGDYTVTITDGNGCSTTHSVTLEEPPAIELDMSFTPVSSEGANDATATVVPSGGTGGYSILWTDGQTTATAINLAPGLHCVTVTDANGCSEEGCVFIPVFGCSMTLEISSPDIDCFNDCNGAIDLTVLNGTAPYTYAWSDAMIDDIEDPDNLCPGTYSVTVIDADQCTATIITTIGSPPEITGVLEYTIHGCSITCLDDLNATINGGTPPYTYNWSNGATTEDLEDICLMDYFLTVTDAVGCTEVFEPTVFTTPNPITASVTVSQISCFGVCDGTISVIVTGGYPPYDYDWVNDDWDGQSEISDVCAGDYFVVVTDSEGCSVSVAVTLDEPSEIVAQTATTDACFGECDGTADITITGGTPPYTFEWQVDPENLCPGDYSFTVTDAHGCTLLSNFTIVENPEMTYTLEEVNDEMNTQSDGSIDITPGGGTPPYTFEWTDESGNVVSMDEDPQGLPMGIYTCEITDENGCVLLTEEVIIDNIVNTFEPLWSDQIQVFPNPVENQLTISYEFSDVVDIRLELFDIRGVKVNENESITNGIDFIDFSQLAKGVYTLRVSSSEHFYSFKIVKIE